MRLLLILSLCAAGPVLAQSDECREAFAVRDELREKMNAAKPDWRALHYKAKQQTQRCDLLESLWKLRAALALKANDPADAKLATGQAKNQFVLRDPEFEALLASTPTDFNPAAPTRRFWALVAGAGAFRDKNIKAFDYAARDLREIQGLLGRWGYPTGQILTALDKEFTKATLAKRFSELREKVEADDVVVVYVLSHGTEGAEDANSSSVLLTYDSDVSSPQRRYETGIQVIGLVQEMFRELKAKRVVLMLDACFSGDAITGQRSPGGQPSPRFLDMLTQNSGRVIISAGSADQRTWELPQRKMGAFAYCFVSAAAKYPEAAVVDLFPALQACVGQEVAKLSEKPEQSPSLYASDRAKRITLADPNKRR